LLALKDFSSVHIGEYLQIILQQFKLHSVRESFPEEERQISADEKVFFIKP